MAVHPGSFEGKQLLLHATLPLAFSYPDLHRCQAQAMWENDTEDSAMRCLGHLAWTICHTQFCLRNAGQFWSSTLRSNSQNMLTHQYSHLSLHVLRESFVHALQNGCLQVVKDMCCIDGDRAWHQCGRFGAKAKSTHKLN